MKTNAHKIIISLLCFFMSLTLFSAVFAAEENNRIYDTSFITGFEPADYEQTIDTEYKYALIVLSEQFPGRLTVRLGGTAHYQESENGSRILTDVENYAVKEADAVWKCLENYDEDLDVFHFVPAFGEYKLAESVELPVITVNVLGELPIPPMPPIHEEEMLPEIPVSQESLRGKDAIPSYYNGYSLKNLPAVRNQNPYGTCWAFATITAVEADLIHDKKAGIDIDLSELHLAYFTNHVYYDEKGLNIGDTITINDGVNYLDAGGTDYKASFALFNMLGPVQESAVPYSSAAEYLPDPSEGRAGDYQITGYYRYGIKSDRNSVKNAILNHGAVTASYRNNRNYYSAVNNSYYYPEPAETSHTITIVGWDNDFSRDNFISGTPEGDGAWLIRNSWGVDNYNYGGYFWMSYYDNSLSTYGYAFDAQPGQYDYVYSYDNCPGTSARLVGSDGTAEVTFFVDENEEIQAIGFYTFYTNLGLRFTVSSGNSNVSQSFATTNPGYYLIPLSNPLTILERSKVTVKYSYTGGSDLYAAYEKGPYGAGNDITYYSDTGSEGMVVNGVNTGYDGKIKLFTNELEPTTAVTIRDPEGTDITGKEKTISTVSYQLKAVAEPPKALQSFTWTSSDTAVAAVDSSSGKVSFRKAGTVTITATSADGSGKSAFVKLKLLPEATAIVIKNASGTDITGKMVNPMYMRHRLYAAATPADAEQTVKWKSSNTDVATVSAKGLVAFKKVGTVTITAASTDRGKAASSVKLKLLPEAAAITITNTSGTDITGKTVNPMYMRYRLYAGVKPANAAQTVKWTSSNTDVATVSAKGLVSFKKAGTVTITATSKDRAKVTASVKLKLLPEAASIVIKDPDGTAVTGKTVTIKTKTCQLTAAARPANASQKVTWTSGNTDIATVSAAGKVTFKKVGTVTITAMSKDRGKKSASVKLKYAP